MLVFQRLARGLTIQIMRRHSSSSVQAAAKKNMDPPDVNNQKKIKSPLVTAAFESLKQEATTDTEASTTKNTTQQQQLDPIDEKIVNAKSVKSLLAVVEGNGQITMKQALKIVSILAEWSSIKRAKVAEFENDPRFIKVCRLLGRTVPKNSNQNKLSGYRNDDLNTVLGIAGDDEAAKLVASISLPQMVKVMTTLALRKRRSTPLLRSLAFNISSNSEQLDLKQSADILYAMSTLNFPDSVLAAKVCVDIQAALPANSDKSAAVGSILTSLGLLKYRDLDVLDSLSSWILKHNEICRPQDISAMFLTLGTLNYKSQNIEQIKTNLVKVLTMQDFSKHSDWLNHVWALSLLKLAKSEQIDSVLRKNFIEKLEKENGGLTPNAKMKLLNINSYAKHLMESYKGSFLSTDSPVYSVPLAHTKSKQILINAMLDALKNLLPSSNSVKTLVDSKMGFLIDAQCALDPKRNPLPIDTEDPNSIKVAIMVVDFHDMCHGTHRSVTGLTNQCFQLLEKSGLKVLSVPYNEFSTSDKLLKRVQYLETKLKNIVSVNK